MREEQGNFLEIFKEGQEAILATLEQVKQHVRTYAVVQPILVDLEEKIFTHLRLESERILPCLEKFFYGRHDAILRIEFQRYEIRDLKLKSMTFFDPYRSRPSAVTIRNLPINFLDFRKSLVEHIQREVDFFVPLLDEFLRSTPKE